MNRPAHTALAAAVVTAVAVASAVPALAVAPGPKRTLTATEYRQLSAEQVALKKLRHEKRLTWNEIYAVCHKVGQSTLLLQSVRANCETGVGIDQSLVGFYADLERCSALSTGTGTTTTTTPAGTTTTTTTPGATTTTPPGTTTTSTGTVTTSTGTTTGTSTTDTGTTTTATGTLSPTELKLYACLQPEYTVIGRAARSVYVAQSALRRQVLARRFVGRCLLTLAPTARQLQLLDRFVVTARQLAAEVDLITKVADGQKPASAINLDQIEKDSAAFSTAGRAFELLHRPQNLSVCRHQAATIGA